MTFKMTACLSGEYMNALKINKGDEVELLFEYPNRNQTTKRKVIDVKYTKRTIKLKMQDKSGHALLLSFYKSGKCANYRNVKIILHCKYEHVA